MTSDLVVFWVQVTGWEERKMGFERWDPYRDNYMFQADRIAGELLRDVGIERVQDGC